MDKRLSEIDDLVRRIDECLRSLEKDCPESQTAIYNAIHAINGFNGYTMREVRRLFESL